MMMTRSFRGRLLVAFLSLFLVVQVISFFIIDMVITRSARERAGNELKNSAAILQQFLKERSELLIQGASIFSRDYAFQQAFFNRDKATIRSALESLRMRIHGDFILLLEDDPQYPVTVQSPEGTWENHPFRWPALVDEVLDAGKPGARVVTHGQGLIRIVIVPLLAPEPVAWFCVGFHMDQTLVTSLEKSIGFGVSLSIRESGEVRLAASTLPPSLQPGLQELVNSRDRHDDLFQGTLGGETHVIHNLPYGDASSGLILHGSLEKALQPLRKLQRILIAVAVSTLIIVLTLGIIIARGVTRPVERLVAAVKRVADGDLETEVAVERNDELGTLALSFNQMILDLAEKERVRNLLGKVVSKQVAEELLRGDSVQLGGEIREVTVMFTDLRNFTATCEHMAPQEVLHFINRYLDRMSRIIEDHGGVIDKFIGDAIMALFGAPVPYADHAARAVACARAMQAALETLNEDFNRDGLPAVWMGIGLHTGEVVAGNMGAEHRLNYTVIGDTVNLASRLESESKRFVSPLLFSEATVEAASLPADSVTALGSLQVRGRQQPVRVFTLTELVVES